MPTSFTSGKFSARDADGNPLAGGLVYTYATGTLTPQATYTTYALTQPNQNPVVLDSRGEASIWFDDLAYRVIVRTAADVTIYDSDNLNRANAGSVAFDYGATYASGSVGKWLQNLALSAGSTFLGWIQAGASAVLRTVSAKLRERVSVMDFGATGDGSTDDYTAIAAAISAVSAAGGGTVYFPRPTAYYKHGSTIQGADGIRLEGEGSPDRWRSAKKPVRLVYTGNVAALKLTPAIGAGIDSFQIANLHLDGSSAGSAAVGVHWDATAASSYIEGVLVENSAITNFPVNQALHDNDAFDITYRRVNISNPDRAASSHLVWMKGSTPTQTNFDDCWIAPYTDGAWGVVSAAGDVRFFGGTIAPYGSAGAGNGANGVKANGSLLIYGTHVENGSATNTTNIGIQYTGSGGAFISPSECALFGIGVKIGDGTSAESRGWTIAGCVGNNNTGVGGVDIQITAGGSRIGTITSTGFANGVPTVSDLRYSTDGVSEVIQMQAGDITGPSLFSESGTAGAPSHSFRAATTTGAYYTGSGVGVSVGGTAQMTVSSTAVSSRSRIYPGTPAGALQSAAGIYGGTGVPDNADGVNGEFYFRSDGGGGTRIYQKVGGTWTAFA